MGVDAYFWQKAQQQMKPNNKGDGKENRGKTVKKIR